MSGQKLYEGKAKILYAVPGNSQLVVHDFKNSLTAFNGEKKGQFENKGKLNRDITSLIFRYLNSRGVSSHWVEDQGETGMVTKKLEIIPLEVVIRNVAAGSLAKRLGWPEGKELPQPIVEFYYKSDLLGDPLVNEDHIQILNCCKPEELIYLRKMAQLINAELTKLFQQVEFRLIDFKLEFGRDSSGQILLADEVTPDTCRLWDLKTNEKFDKDRFRRDLGNIEDAYKEVYWRLTQLSESQTRS
ncbi:MAG: phosphoribosylaminoimidazolesuccinocarboxamide synthase [Bdellovibrionales bacterium]